MKKMTKAILGNWKTTAAAALAALGIVFTEVAKFLDADPETVCDWNMVMIGGILVLIGLFAKDGDKSTEELGI